MLAAALAVALRAIPGPVAIGVRVAGVGALAELAQVAQPVAVLIARRLVHVQREAVAHLPPVRDPVAVAVALHRQGRDGEHGRQHPCDCDDQRCLPHRFLLEVAFAAMTPGGGARHELLGVP
jgi:hypothetical protein